MSRRRNREDRIRLPGALIGDRSDELWRESSLRKQSSSWLLFRVEGLLRHAGLRLRDCHTATGAASSVLNH